MEHVIDATNKKLGRIATEAAMVLMGKNVADFQPNKVAAHKVVIQNASKADISEKKKDTTFYDSYSGYPGGLKKTSMRRVIEKKGFEEIFRKAVFGMLPGNKLRAVIMKNLTVNE